MFTIRRRVKAGERGQTSLELTAALIMVVMLLLASVKIFLWLNARIVNQQVDYEDTRLAAGTTGNQTVDLYNPASTNGVSHNVRPTQALNLFN